MYKTRYGCKRMATIVFNQIVIMFIILILGVICSKTGIITEQMIERLSVLLLQVIGPIVIRPGSTTVGQNSGGIT